MATQPPSTLPTCNVTSNGKDYYDPNPLSSVGNTIGGALGLYSSACTFCICLIVTGVSACANKGFQNMATKIFLACTVICLAAAGWSYYGLKKIDDNWTEKCQPQAMTW